MSTVAVAAEEAIGRGREKPSRLTRQRVCSAWLFMAPMLIVLALVAGWPLLRTIWFSLTDANRSGHAASPGAGIPGTTRSPGACSASSSAGSARSPLVARMMAATWW